MASREKTYHLGEKPLGETSTSYDEEHARTDDLPHGAESLWQKVLRKIQLEPSDSTLDNGNWSNAGVQEFGATQGSLDAYHWQIWIPPLQHSKNGEHTTVRGPSKKYRFATFTAWSL